MSEKPRRYWDVRVKLNGEEMSRGKAYQTLRRAGKAWGMSDTEASNCAQLWLNEETASRKSEAVRS